MSNPKDDNEGMGFLDKLLDGAEAVVGGAEKVFADRSGGKWVVEEVTDAQSGLNIHQVKSARGTLETTDANLAHWVAQRLNGGGR
jgi:hypothetical protein